MVVAFIGKANLSCLAYNGINVQRWMYSLYKKTKNNIYCFNRSAN